MRYSGMYNNEETGGALYETDAPYHDGMFTDRAEMALQFFIDNNNKNGITRHPNAPTTVEDPREVLEKLGYIK
jgi:hypothetical protein